MNSEEESKRQIRFHCVVLGLSLAVSIIIGFVPDWSGTTFTVADQTLLTVGLFVAFLLLDILWILSASSFRQKKEYEVWQILNDADRELTNIRHHFAEITKISHGGKDLFVSHFMKDIHNLARKIKDAADKQELRTASDFYIRAEDIFESFVGDPNPVLRYTWPIKINERILEEPAWWRFFEVTTSMVEQKTIKGVEALLILDDRTAIDTPRIKKLLDFFHTNSGQECRIVMRNDFDRICRENDIPLNYLDFGIYGNRMLFRSEQYKPEYIGRYTKDTGTIREYSKFFNTLWSSLVTSKNPSTATEVVTFGELMNLDKE